MEEAIEKERREKKKKKEIGELFLNKSGSRKRPRSIQLTDRLKRHQYVSIFPRLPFVCLPDQGDE